ncbi:MAG: DMT family transporter [Alphaproteobacteria bacterium]|nr:DMT family transporter [Alphaproteobacteria bacterium]
MTTLTDWRAPLLVLASSALWGLFWWPHRALAEFGLGGTWAAFVEYACAAAMLLAYVGVRRRNGGLAGLRRPWPGLLMGIAFVLYANGVLLTTVANALLMFYLAPVWATLLETVVLRHRLRAGRIGAIALGLGGLWVLTSEGGGVPWPANLGDDLSLLSGMVGAVALLMFQRGGSGDTFGQVFGFNVFGTLVTLASIPLVTGTFAPPPFAAIDPMAWLLLPAMAAVFMIATTYGTMWGASRMSAGRAGILMMTDIVIGVASAAVLTAEPFGWRQAVATGLILCAGLVEVLAPGGMARRPDRGQP